MRVSDLERQRTIDELRRHCAAGRLDVDDYAGRIEKAMSSTTFEELDALVADLPMLRIAEPAGLVHSVSRAGGKVGRGDDSSDRSVRRRLTASAIAILTVLVVVTVVAIALVSSWGWAIILLAGWAVGIATGRLTRPAR